MSRKAYSYLRFSTPEQSKGDSFRRQATLAHRWCITNGIELDESLTFQDLGVSAYRGDNAETGRLGDFLDAVRAGAVNRGSYLLVESLDRISRLVPLKALNVLTSIVYEGITLVTLNDNAEYTEQSLNSDYTSLLVAILTFVRANEESATKSRRLKEVWANKRDKALEKPLTTITPAWIEMNRETGEMHLIPERVKVLKRIFKMSLEGVGMSRIARTLTEEKTPTWGTGKVWQKSYISKIQKNPAVYGGYVPHIVEHTGTRAVRTPIGLIEGYYPPAIDKESFNTLQAMKSGYGQSRARGKVQNILSGLGACPLCGGTMLRVDKGARSKPKLVCTNAKNGAGCNYHSVHLSFVENSICHHAETLAQVPPAAHTLDDEWERLSNALDGTQDMIESIVDAIARKPLKPLQDKLEELETERETISAKLDELTLKMAVGSDLVLQKRAEDLTKTLNAKELDLAKANSILKQLFDKVVVNYPNGSLDFLYKNGASTQIVFADVFRQ